VTVFPGVCTVTSCPFNLGNGRVACDWLRGGRGRCHHHAYREAWTAGHELEQAQAGEAVTILTAMETARSLTSRATAAQRPMDAATARQRALAFAGENVKSGGES